MKKVLIVDDDRATSAGMADVVEDWGYEAEVAGTVKAGWNSVSRMVPDVAIVDLKLPDGSGLDLLHRIKETYPDVSVVIRDHRVAPIHQRLETRGEGVHLIAMKVDDLEATLVDLRAKGVRLVGDPGAGNPVRGQVFIHPQETGGVLTQLVQA